MNVSEGNTPAIVMPSAKTLKDRSHASAMPVIPATDIIAPVRTSKQLKLHRHLQWNAKSHPLAIVKECARITNNVTNGENAFLLTDLHTDNAVVVDGTLATE
ncbi:hypothetical protein COOONC_09382 [Cooperia oncophora]